MTDGTYRMLTLNSSGRLTFSAPTECDIWACGAGGGGMGNNTLADMHGYGAGGGGGYPVNLTKQVVKSLVVEIGAGGEMGNSGGTTSINGSVVAAADGGHSADQSGSRKGGDGGSGGGGGGFGITVDPEDQSVNTYAPGGTGCGVSTRPFLDLMQPPYCAGGAGDSSGYVTGGNGGSDGKNGGFSQNTLYGPAAGGILGGGAPGYAGTAYGAGGGGYSANGNINIQGYQGCVMIRIWVSDEKLPSQSYVSFSIDGDNYFAEQNMTWGEWCDSFYNTAGCRVEENGAGTMSTIYIGARAVCDYDNLYWPSASDKIVAANYHTM